MHVHGLLKKTVF